MSSYGSYRFFMMVALAGCASQQTPKTAAGPSVEDYVPLKVGAARTYAVKFPGQTGKRTITIIKQEDGYFVDDAGGAFRITKDGLRDRARYLIRKPIQEGHSWKAIVSASAVEHYRIISVGQPCRSQAGSFSDCLVVESTVRRDKSMSLRIRWSWAKAIGLAKIETFAEIKDKGRVPQTEQSLVHYRLDPPDKKEAPKGSGFGGM